MYQCVLLSWEISLAKQVENNSLEMLQKSYVSKSEDGMVKIYWAVNGMKQDDPILIEFIRKNVLVKPSYKSTKGLFIKTWFQRRGRTKAKIIKVISCFPVHNRRQLDWMETLTFYNSFNQSQYTRSVKAVKSLVEKKVVGQTFHQNIH